MGKQILATIVWAVITFIILAAVKYFTKVDSWLMNTLNWVVPSAVGYFLGYGQARIDEIID